MKRWLLLLTLIGLASAACAPAPAAQPPTPTATPVPPTATPAPTEAPSAVQAAVKALAAALGLSVDQIVVVSTEEVEWPDACLGVLRPEVTCAAVVTPGYRIVLEVNDTRYEYHTNADGSAVAPVNASVLVEATEPVVLTWHREDGIAGFCDELAIFATGEARASWCKPQAVISPSIPLTPDEQAQLDEWLSAYGTVSVTMKDPATADAMTLTLTLSGNSSEQPTEAEKQAMLDWAQTVYNRLRGS